MYLKHIKLTSFRNCSSAEAELPPGTTIILGGNGAGKTTLLEAALYSACGRSFRTSHDSEMIKKGESLFRVEALIERGDMVYPRTVGFEAGGGARVNSGGGPKWLAPGAVLCFSPDDLRLVKGPPAVRRRFLDEALTRGSRAAGRLLLDHKKVLAQRNTFLQRARSGRVRISDIAPWDKQLARLDLRIFELRRKYCEKLSPLFGGACREITDAGEGAAVVYRSQLAAILDSENPEAALLAALAESWQRDMERLSTGVGSHRDDMEFLLEGKSLRIYGSQGEQRTAVLALLLASRELGGENGDPLPLLLLDDVMSELDQDRRRRLMGAIGYGMSSNGKGNKSTGQVIITAADRSLFSDAELAASAVLEVRAGKIVND